MSKIASLYNFYFKKYIFIVMMLLIAVVVLISFIRITPKPQCEKCGAQTNKEVNNKYIYLYLVEGHKNKDRSSESHISINGPDSSDLLKVGDSINVTPLRISTENFIEIVNFVKHKTIMDTVRP